ncbi:MULTISPECIES: ZIP family metal transporter [Haloarcula]|uniref:ZIP family metal transporter n=1 Tax=Haloarcula pellucida TaxID=1427151 RepID=A0A830GJS7_9EURY|nr:MULTISPECIES: ZIP family metal transporter [Halomicroarcula]MBX0348391.1 ZIP family metal transporter [Halomicroarcula pellucida]MDS0278213.1 ZIP family metal transporter [Halomicroarcula sp. S1AR25-4]GGN93589.1 ZIP family metal transporter [Halomicroarcula pellucida]
MPINGSSTVNKSARPSLLGVASVVGLLALSAVGATGGLQKVLVISWVAFAAMGLGAWLGARAARTSPHSLVWGYGLASGAMVTSAAMFLVPQAMGLGSAAGTPRIGGIGIAVGIVAGYGTHTVGHRLTHVDTSFDTTTAAIAAHALSAGLIIGLVYGTMPTLGLLLGLAIVSHKGPAGYAAARRLNRDGKTATSLLLPAAGVGLTAIPSALLPVPQTPVVNALVFGFAAGIFLHVAMDFLPNCEAGSEIDEVCSLQEHSHDLLDELRTHAVGSTVGGAALVVLAWVVVMP